MSKRNFSVTKKVIGTTFYSKTPFAQVAKLFMVIYSTRHLAISGFLEHTRRKTKQNKKSKSSLILTSQKQLQLLRLVHNYGVTKVS